MILLFASYTEYWLHRISNTDSIATLKSYLCGHKKHGIEEHKIMPGYCQMVGVLKREDN